jgi:hypothetical protein
VIVTDPKELERLRIKEYVGAKHGLTLLATQMRVSSVKTQIASIDVEIKEHQEEITKLKNLRLNKSVILDGLKQALKEKK